MILITSANGNQGKLLLPKLLASGQKVRACVQSEASAVQLRAAGVSDVVVGNIMDRDVMARAFERVRKVYHVGPTLHPDERAMGFAMVDMAREKGVDHFVFSSVLHAITTDLLQHEIKRDIEEHLLSSGLEFTILQPSNYMMPLRLIPVFNEGVFRLSWSLDRKQSMVDLADVTDVVASVLGDSEQHFGATYELVGPSRYTGHEIGAAISTVLGRSVRVEQISADDFFKARLGDDALEKYPYQMKAGRAISARYSSHDFVGNPNVLTMLLGRSPTTFEQFVRNQYEGHVKRMAGATL